MSLQIGLPGQIDEKPREACDCPPFVFLDIGVVQGSLHVFAEDDGHWETVFSVQCRPLCTGSFPHTAGDAFFTVLN